MNDELVIIPEENVYLEFTVDNKCYAVISDTGELKEGDEVYFAKIDFVDGDKIATSIQSEEEHNKVLAEYNRILVEVGAIE